VTQGAVSARLTSAADLCAFVTARLLSDRCPTGSRQVPPVVLVDLLAVTLTRKSGHADHRQQLKFQLR